MITMIKNNGYRLRKIKKNLLLYYVLTLFALFLGLYMSNHSTTYRIAVTKDVNLPMVQQEQITIKQVNVLPSMSELILHRYDAYATLDENQALMITSVHGDAYDALLKEAIQSGEWMQNDQRVKGTGETLLGFMMMFLLLQAFTNMALYGEDEEKGCLKRLLTSPISVPSYLLGHFISSFLFSYLPIIMTLVVLTFCGIDIGFSLVTYSWLLFLLSALGSSFALLLYTIISKEDDANMIGSALLLLTSLLSGGFITFQTNNEVFQTLLYLLPQKNFLAILAALEDQTFSWMNGMQLLYLLGLCLFFLWMSVRSLSDTQTS